MAINPHGGQPCGLGFGEANFTSKLTKLSKRRCNTRVTSSGLSMEPPKTSSGRRVVDVDSRTVDVLKGHRKKQDEIALCLGMPLSKMVFPRDGVEGWCHPNTLSHALSSLAKKAGCQKITFRSLRHSHATVALQTGQNIVAVSKRLGHKNVSTTLNIYVHALPGWQRETAEAFARAMDDKG